MKNVKPMKKGWREPGDHDTGDCGGRVGYGRMGNKPMPDPYRTINPVYDRAMPPIDPEDFK